MIGRAALGVLLVLAVLGGAPARADTDYRVTAAVQPSGVVGESDTLRLVIEVEGERSPEVTPPSLAGLRNLRVIGGPSQGFRSVWANGRASFSLTLTYVLMPEGAGKAQIPPLAIQVGGSTYRTQPIEIEVRKGSAAAGSGPPGGSQRSRTPTGERDAADVFVQAELGADEVWVGQAVPLTVLLYSAVDVADARTLEAPPFSNYWVEDLEVDPNGEAYRQTLRGRRYVVYPWARKILVPQVTGRQVIEPHALRLEVRSRRSSDPFDLFGFGRTQTIVRKSGELQLAVRELPAKGRPEGFSGAVGSFKLDATLDRAQANVNDAVALTITVEGDGSLRGIDAPPLDFPSSVKVFDPKSTASYRPSRTGLSSSKTWEWVLVPLAPGSLKLPEVRFDYFDPTTGSYRVARAVLDEVAVQRGDASDPSPVARRDVKQQRIELRYIKPLRGPLQTRSLRAHEQKSFLLLALLPLISAPLAIWLGRRHDRLQRDRGLARARRAGSRARTRLRAASRRAADGDPAWLHGEVARALTEYVADRFDRSAAGLTYDDAERLLGSRGIDGELRKRFRSCLETCDFARFVPGSDDPQSRAELLREAERIVERLERTT